MQTQISAETSAGHSDLAAPQLLNLQARSYGELLSEWRRLFRSPPPKRIGRDLLLLGIAWKIQEQLYGGHSPGVKRTLSDLSKAVEQCGDVPRDRIAAPKEGAVLQREWRGTVHTVKVLPDAFEWSGKRWQSLSAIAREIAGTRWSGPRFFGLKVPERSLVRVRGGMNG